MKGVGIGFRRDLADDLIGAASDERPSFIELAPENWIDMGGAWGKKLRQAAEIYPITTHGLSLSIGSPDPLDFEFLKKIKVFIKDFNVQLYSEHLSYSKCDNAHLYDLLPIPFRSDAVKHIADRIKTVQDYLEMPLVLENVSYYTPVGAEMSEHEFISSVVSESGCRLLLDVNNVFVNAFNHQYDPQSFILNLPLDKVSYIHMAGHTQVDENTIIDTHGEAIIDPVYELFEWALDHITPVPVLLERDFNIPGFGQVKEELMRLESIVEKKWSDVKITE